MSIRGFPSPNSPIRIFRGLLTSASPIEQRDAYIQIHPGFAAAAQYRCARGRIIASSLLFALLAPLSLLIDLPVTRFFAANKLPGDLQRILTWSEVAAHGLGIAILAGTIFILDPLRRRFLPRLLAGALGAGLCADAMKLVVARLRPRYLDLDSGVFDTFAGWLPIVFPVEGRSALDSKWLSLPSGHTAVAVAFAIGLSRLYPRGRWLFGFFALFATLQRIEAGAHYVSDTLAGAAIGAVMMIAIAESRLVGSWFDRIERYDSDESVSVLD